MVDVDESQQQDEIVTPGKMLLAARLRAALTQEQVAKELYMTVSKVKALETDDYGRLNSDTFARGYIRAYANLVKLDVPAVLAAYDALIGEEKEPVNVAAETEPAAKKGSEAGQRGAWQFLAIIAAFFVGLWLISVWFFDNHTDKQEETRYLVPAPSISPVVISPEEVERMHAAASAAANSASAVSVSAAASSSGANASANAGAAGPAAKAASSVAHSVVSSATGGASELASTEASSAVSASVPAVKKVALDEISFSFRAESWLEVSDSRGDVLATELQPAGSQIKLVGLAPFDVKLGNAPAVAVQLNGKKIDVIPLLGTNVLIMKVGN